MAHNGVLHDEAVDGVVLSVSACWMRLRSVEVGRLAVSVGDQPDVFPINYVVDHGTLVFRTAPGTKLAAIQVNPVVALEVDGRDGDTDEVFSVVVKGIAQRIRHVDELLDQTTTLPLFPWDMAPKGQFVRLVPTEVTGRRFAVVDLGAWDPLAHRSRSLPE